MNTMSNPKVCESIFREYPTKQSERSDRSAGDRARHNYKIRQKIKDGLTDVVADESLIGQSGDKKIKIPIKLRNLCFEIVCSHSDNT